MLQKYDTHCFLKYFSTKLNKITSQSTKNKLGVIKFAPLFGLSRCFFLYSWLFLLLWTFFSLICIKWWTCLIMKIW